MGRNPNGTSSIYEGKDGWWHGRVTVGVLDSGKPDRRHVQAMTKAAVIKKARKLEKDRDNGAVRKPGKSWTVEAWLNHWLYEIVAQSVRETTFSGYRVDVEKHLIPGVGAHKLHRLEPEYLEKLYAKIMKNGGKPGTAHHVHRTIRTALGVAVRRGHITHNSAKLAKAPELPDEETEPYTLEEVQRLLEAVKERRNSARWAIALALGLRQGEVLGLKWKDVDLDSGTLRVRRARPRPKYEHGCGNACGRKAGYCPQRRQTNEEATDTKSRAGRRTIGLPDELVTLLRQHERRQDEERQAARQLWRDGGWVFATPTGGPLNPNTDYHEWKRLLVAAGLRDARLHDARHTAATVLLILGVPERAAMGIMGWSSSAMAKRYQHITYQMRRDIAKQVGGLLWSAQREPAKDHSDAPGEDDEDGSRSV